MHTPDPVDHLMREYAAGDGPGASLLVIRDGQPIVRRSYGLADVDARTPATPATNYRLASVTKQFTAAAILALASDGKLTLDDRVQRWLPSLPQDDVTIRHLLTHTSGLIDYEDVMSPDTSVQLRDVDVLKLLESQDSTYFAPGTSYRYSNSGYALLALIVERASGQSFATFLRERIFTPLGMQATVAFEDGISRVEQRAFGHSIIDGRWSRTDQSMTSAVLGDGGIYSSIDDLARWDAALYDPRYGPAFVPATPTDDANVKYGFGWRISRHRGNRLLWHSGETIGFRNVLLRFPGQRLTVVLLTNRNDPEPYKTALAIADLYLREGQDEEVALRDAGPPSSADLEESCNRGDGSACANLAFLYATGEGVERDDARATPLYVRSCELGDPRGCYNVGLNYEEGRGVAPDLPRAIAAYIQSCEGGSTTGCTNLGYHYQNGIGVEQDQARAVELYHLACAGTDVELPNLLGCVNEGRAYRDGIGVPVDLARALVLFEDACNRPRNDDDVGFAENQVRACLNTGHAYFDGAGTEVDLGKAAIYYQRACDGGEQEACEALAGLQDR